MIPWLERIDLSHFSYAATRLYRSDSLPPGLTSIPRDRLCITHIVLFSKHSVKTTITSAPRNVSYFETLSNPISYPISHWLPVPSNIPSRLRCTARIAYRVMKTPFGDVHGWISCTVPHRLQRVRIPTPPGRQDCRRLRCRTASAPRPCPVCEF